MWSSVCSLPVPVFQVVRFDLSILKELPKRQLGGNW